MLTKGKQFLFFHKTPMVSLDAHEGKEIPVFYKTPMVSPGAHEG